MRRFFHSAWFRSGSAFAAWLLLAGFAAAQTATPPPPPADTPQDSLQQPAPETNVRAVRLNSVYGSVKVLSDGQVDFQQADLNMPLVQGMKIVTADDGRAEIELEDGSVARVTPNSSITLTKLNRAGDGTAITQIEADSGLTYYELDSRAGQYSVTFGPDTITPVDSAIFRVDLDSSPAQVAVMHGSVHAANDQGLEAEAQTDQTLQLNLSNPNEYQLEQSITANSWDQWNSDRDQALAQVAANASASGGDESPALAELDASGDWYDVPGYGTGWSPSGVGADWDPYGTGSWGYYTGIGYTWISPYSWGWWPYHCGAWSWFDGFGWLWFPGNCGWGGIGVGRGWYPYGTVWTAPPGYRIPRRPLVVHPPHGPIHQPKHGPRPAEPVILVNRQPTYRSIASTDAPRLLRLNGNTIAPITGVHTRNGFTAGKDGQPGSFIRPAYGTTFRPGFMPGTTQPVNRPGTGFMPAPRPGNLGTRIQPSQPVRAPAPVFRAPQPMRFPAMRAPEPSPVFHAPPSPPSFHPAAPASHGR